MSRTLELKAVDSAGDVSSCFVHLQGDKHLPIVLGTGRNAVVFLATTKKDPDNPSSDYRALKFLRDDVDKQYARAAADRFFQEAGKAQQFKRTQAKFVTYYSWGAIGRPGEIDETGEVKDFWWRVQFKQFVDRIVSADDEWLRLKKYYDLQGPFYALDLCQGTLHDLLDKAKPWWQLPAYSIHDYRHSLFAQARKDERDLAEFADKFLTGSPQGLSGYDILNSFRHDDSAVGRTANRIRNLAVLKLFEKVVHTVAELHTARSDEPLAHRDLKPGNIFIEHSAESNGIGALSVKLSDFGYIADPGQLGRGDYTLIAGRKGIEYLAPGSQFYRAPEQAELPIEVRIDIDPANPYVVRIRGSKIGDIQVHDWLSISDVFNDDTKPRDRDLGLFKILRLTPNAQGDCYELLLDRLVATSQSDDLQGQITKATGFHTDGFSLGAILYDMISGGKNPELFYTYCLASFTKRFVGEYTYTIDDIIEILAPQRIYQADQGDHAQVEQISVDRINPIEKARVAAQIVGAPNLEGLFTSVVEILSQKRTNNTNAIASDGLSAVEKGKAMAQTVRAHDLDGMLTSIIHAVLADRKRTDGTSEEQVEAELKDYLKNYRFRSFHLVNDLLRDRRGVPIPRDILAIIVKCMLRDVEGAYYMCDPEKAFLSEENIKASTRIHKDVRVLLSQDDYMLREAFPHALQEDLLFKLRCLSLEVTTSGQGQNEAPPEEPPSIRQEPTTNESAHGTSTDSDHIPDDVEHTKSEDADQTEGEMADSRSEGQEQTSGASGKPMTPHRKKKPAETTTGSDDDE